MKCRLSITVDEETVELLRGKLRNSGDFRNKSHLVEKAIREYCGGGRDE